MRKPRLVAKWLAKGLFAALFITSGIGHFLSTETFVKIMPPYLPFHWTLVIVSGAFEILLGVLLLIPKTSRIAAWELVALLIAVFPANLFMYQHRELFHVSSLALLLRLPLQAALILWAYVYTRPASSGRISREDRIS